MTVEDDFVRLWGGKKAKSQQSVKRSLRDEFPDLQWFELLDSDSFKDKDKAKEIFERLTPENWDTIMASYSAFQGEISVLLRNILLVSTWHGHEQHWPDKVWDGLFEREGWQRLIENMAIHSSWAHTPHKILAALPIDYWLEREMVYSEDDPYYPLYLAAVLIPNMRTRALHPDVWLHRPEDYKKFKAKVMAYFEGNGRFYKAEKRAELLAPFKELDEKICIVVAARRAAKRIMSLEE